jgi:hypothetical protein
LAIKKKDHERLDDANIERVIALLEQDKPVTIKAACEELNIAPNGPRLKKIIQDYRDRVEEEKKRRAANRGKPANEFEIHTIVEDYLSGDPIKNIADRLYRPVAFVKQIIDRVGVPQALPGETYNDYGPLPEQCIAESFSKGDYVWSSKYGAIAEVDADCGDSSDGLTRVYRIYVHQRIDEEKSLVDGKRFAYHVTKGGGFYAHQRAYDLGSLAHLTQYGVNVQRAVK